MNNEPAFPSHGSMGEVTHEGIDLLSHVALEAMKGWLATYVHEDDIHPVKNDCQDSLCSLSFDLAEAFLAERARRLAASAQEEGR